MQKRDRKKKMKISDKGLDLIKTFEGFSPNVYKDQAGLDTIGYGHLITDDEKGAGTFAIKLTPGEATELLRRDATHAEEAVNKLVKVSLTENQFSALCSWTFNLGVNALRTSTLLKRLNKGDYDLASEFLKWSKVRNPKTGKLETSQGLLTRRQKEAELFSKAD